VVGEHPGFAVVDRYDLGKLVSDRLGETASVRHPHVDLPGQSSGDCADFFVAAAAFAAVSGLDLVDDAHEGRKGEQPCQEGQCPGDDHLELVDTAPKRRALRCERVVHGLCMDASREARTDLGVTVRQIAVLYPAFGAGLCARWP